MCVSNGMGCKGCEIACAVEHSKGKGLFLAAKESPAPKKRVQVSGSNSEILSIHCQHCEDAPCITVCMSGALAKDKKTGATLQDKDRCVGCWMCVMACPFSVIARDIEDHIAVKCDLCPDIDGFACVAACPTKALFYGTLDEFKEHIKKGTTKKR